MIVRLRTVSMLAALASLVSACSNPPAGDAGVDAGFDGGIDSGVDSGIPDAGCATAYYDCSATRPCCDTTIEICDSVQFICLPNGGGGTTGGSGGLPNDGAQWQEEAVDAGVVGLDGLTAPSPVVQLAVGTGPNLGQLLMRSADAGWSVVPGTPPAIALNGVWADPAGDVFAVGLQDGGVDAGTVPLLIAGSLDAGLAAVNLGGFQASFASLVAVIGLGPGEALAVGPAAESTAATALHLLPDGGLAVEALPEYVSSVFKLAAVDGGGPIYGLASSTTSNLSWVLERLGGIWSATGVYGQVATVPIVQVADLAIGPSAVVTLVGNDGNGNGLVFTLTDGGYFPVPGQPTVPPMTAVAETPTGDLYIAASAPNQPLELLHLDGGLPFGTWTVETLPADAENINSITGDGAGDYFAVGVRSCSLCPGYPLALKRVP